MCNLQAALNLLQEVEQRAAPSTVSRAPASYKGWLPRMTAATNSEKSDTYVWAPQSEFLLTRPVELVEDEMISKSHKDSLVPQDP